MSRARPLPPHQANVKELMARALELESQRWDQDVAPQKLDGRCHSELAIDIIQVLQAAHACTDIHTQRVGRMPTPRCMHTRPPAPTAWPSSLPRQIVSQGQAKAENITPSLGLQMKQILLVELATFLRRCVCPSCLPGT